MISLAAKTASIKEPKRSSALVRQETIASYLFLLPSLIFFLGFVIYPMILCVVTSFFDSTMNRADVFVGFANYAELFADPIFIGALRNTFIIVVVSVPVTCAFSLWVSSAIVDLPEWATSLFRCVFYLPVVTGSVAVTVVWKWMYNNYYGIFNYLGKAVGLIDKNINWLGDEKYALGCIILILLTTSVGQPIVLYVSALGNVDQSIVEAAEVDGATDFQCFWRIKWPAIMPHHPVHPGHHYHQLLPVLRTDPAADLRWPQPQHRYHHVLHLLHCIQALPLWLRQRNGRCAGRYHRHPVGCPVQVWQSG